MTGQQKIAVLGAGTMGTGMTRSLLRAGAAVTVWNRTPAKTEALAEAGATPVARIADAVREAECVITMLYDADAVLEVCDEIVANVSPGTIWLQCATIGLDGMARLAERVDDDAVTLVDAPVLGTKQPAENGTLVVLTSGPRAAVDSAAPVLDAIGNRNLYVGDQLGHATALKLACNAWLATLTAGVAQSLALAEGLGVNPELFLEAIRGGTQDAPYLQRKGAQMLAGDFSPAFALDAATKDVQLVQAACSTANVPTELLDALYNLFTRSASLGHGRDDIASVRAAFTT